MIGRRNSTRKPKPLVSKHSGKKGADMKKILVEEGIDEVIAQRVAEKSGDKKKKGILGFLGS